MDLSDNPRMVAASVLMALGKQMTPEQALSLHGRLLDQRDLNLATALVYEVLRHQSYLNWITEEALARGKDSPPRLRLIICLGLAQLLYFDRLGDHAVVMETVNLAKKIVPNRHGVVNGVLRNIIRARDEGGPWPPQPPTDWLPAKQLAVLHSHPQWLVERWVKQLGREGAEALLKANNRPTPLTVRVNPLKTDRAALKALLPPSRETQLSPWGLALDNFSGTPEKWACYDDGLFAVQDEASQLVGLLADPQPGQTILDACAGLGGKTLALATLAPKAVYTAMDKDEAKLGQLIKEAQRLGVPPEAVTVVAGDAARPAFMPGSFDTVLLDAPCTGLGVIRRRPDLKWNKNQKDLPRLAALQLKLLEALAPLVKPGGRLIYSVCSLSPDEGSEVIKKFLAQNRGFEAGVNLWPDSLKSSVRDGGLYLWPHRHQTDGFFWAVLSNAYMQK